MKKGMHLKEAVSLLKTNYGFGKEIVYNPNESNYSLITSSYKIRIITNLELKDCFVDKKNNIYKLFDLVVGYKIWIECGKFNNRWYK